MSSSNACMDIDGTRMNLGHACSSRLKPLMPCGGSGRTEENKENMPPNWKPYKDGNNTFLKDSKVGVIPASNLTTSNLTEVEPSTAGLQEATVKNWKAYSRQRSSGPRKRKPEDSNSVHEALVKRSRASEQESGVSQQQQYSVCLTSTQVNEASATEECPGRDDDLPAEFIRSGSRMAQRWLSLVQLDLKVRISALKQSRKRVHGVLDKFRSMVRRQPDVENQKWLALFREMDAHHAREGSKLEASLRKVQELQRVPGSGALAACAKAFASTSNLFSR